MYLELSNTLNVVYLEHIKLIIKDKYTKVPVKRFENILVKIIFLILMLF